MYVKIILLCLTTILGVRGFVLPVQKCKLSDSACLKTEFQKAVSVFVSGIKEYGIEVMDVMLVEYVQFDLAGLQFVLKDGKMSGLKDAVIENVEWNTKKQQFSIAFHFTKGNVTGHYIAAGKALVLPINGEGEINFIIDGLQIKITMPYDLVKGPDGKDYVDLKGLEMDYDTKENPRFNLTNLFNGNKELSDRIHAFGDEHWRPLSGIFGRPPAYAAMQIVYKNIQIFFKNVPLSDIAEY